jgi:hypothetical protein
MKALSLTVGCLLLSGIGSLSIGCAGGRIYPTNYNVFVDPAFGDNISDVVGALDDWSSKTNVGFNITVLNMACDDEDIDCISIHPMSLADIKSISENPNTIGITFWHKSIAAKDPYYCDYQGWGNSYVPSGTDFDVQDTRHELGHALGLQHLGAGNVMCKDQGCATLDIQCGDVNEYNELRNIPDVACGPKE